MFGAMLAGNIIHKGRRRAHIIASIIGIIGVAITLIKLWYLLLIGRIIFGFAVGI